MNAINDHIMRTTISDDESDDGFIATLPLPARTSSANKSKTLAEEPYEHIDQDGEERTPQKGSDDGKKKALVVKDSKDKEKDKEEGEEEEEEEEVQEEQHEDQQQQEEEEEEASSTEELADDEFIVEKILDHMVEKGVVKFRVKWEGYDAEEDITWEPESTLREGAEVILEDYLASYGGIEKVLKGATDAAKNKKRNRRSTNAAAASIDKPPKRPRKEHPLETPAPAPVREKEWKPPNGSWEDHIETIDVCDEADTGTGAPKLVVYLNWKNGRKTKHTTEMVYKRCPQKMLRFYENHVRILRNYSDNE
ncbi:hypothetical protein BROUX41_003435 [Berkeleyomyces rouxiae]|uniref:uncharacterized protein n=1 Tax=Berkeleyomyces rouxiae TaxID=2035830 RepID=UPI003B815916